MQNMRRDSTRFIYNIIPDGSQVAIVKFSTTAQVSHQLVTITSPAHRESLVRSLPNGTEGYTCIGCGLLKGIDVSMKYNLSRRHNARLFDGLTDRLKNRIENRAVGAHNRMVVCDSEESDGIGWSLTCQTRSRGSRTIIYYYRCTKCITR